MTVLDYTPDAIRLLTAKKLWRLLRPLTTEDLQQVTPAQWSAALFVVLRDDSARLCDDSARLRDDRHLTALFLSEAERQALEAKFKEDMAALRKKLVDGPLPDANDDRLFVELEWLIDHYAGLWNGLRLPMRGRRPTFTASKRDGRPRTLTPDLEREFLQNIDAVQAEFLERDEKTLSDPQALLIHMARYYKRERGLDTARAKALAKKNLPPLKKRLQRTRSQHRS